MKAPLWIGFILLFASPQSIGNARTNGLDAYIGLKPEPGPSQYRLANHSSNAEQSRAGLCSSIHSSLPIKVAWPSSSDYRREQSRYWSTGCAALQPTCIVYPSSALEVAALVAILGWSSVGERFSIKSGGHNPNLGFSSIQGGPVISLRYLNRVTLDAESHSVRVGPGNRWQDVTTALEASGFTVVGGRVGDVGVGGNLLGGASTHRQSSP